METNNGIFNNVPRQRATCDEILPNDVIIDLVQPATGDRVELIRWDGRNHKTGLEFLDGSTIYQAPFLHFSLIGAMRFAPCPAEYGDILVAFWAIVDLFCCYTGFSREHVVFLVRVVFASWFPDCCTRPITLCLSGMQMDQVMGLFRLLHIFCRRSLMVARLSLDLPFFLHPTLLINAPGISGKAVDFWRASNYRGAVITGLHGTIRNMACTKIIFCETEAAARAWGAEAVHMPLPPSSQQFPLLTNVEEDKLAAEYQPQLLMFRLRHLSPMRQNISSAQQRKFGGNALGGDLPPCIAENPDILAAVTPLIEARARELQARPSLESSYCNYRSDLGPIPHGKRIQFERNHKPSECTARPPR